MLFSAHHGLYLPASHDRAADVSEGAVPAAAAFAELQVRLSGQ